MRKLTTHSPTVDIWVTRPDTSSHGYLRLSTLCPKVQYHPVTLSYKVEPKSYNKIMPGAGRYKTANKINIIRT